MNDTPLTFALSEGQALARRPRFWAVLAGVTAILALSGPFGTYGSMAFAERTLYWALASFGSFWLGFFTSMAVASQAEDWGIAPRVAVALGGLAAGVPISVLLGALSALFFGGPFLPALLGVLPYACAIAVIVGTLYEVIEARAAKETDDLTTPPAGVDWLSNLPAAVGRDLRVLQAQDHYVLAQTGRGQALVRSSMSEAEKALAARGMRVHRSWWVAHHHMERMVHRDGSARLLLRDGESVPVGRAHRRAVRAYLHSGHQRGAPD